MKIYKVAEDPSTFGIKDANQAIISPIIEYLNKDEKVALARFVEVHPDLKDSAITVVTVDGEEPKDALIRAVSYLESYYSLNDKESYSLPGEGKGSYSLPGEGKGSYSLPGEGKGL